MAAKPRIAHLAGPNATIQNSPPLACLMKFGSLPAAPDPDRPTAAEVEAVQTKRAQYQDVFDTH